MQVLKRLLKNHHSLVFLDFEGTQFTHEIIAIGAVKCEINENCQIVKEDSVGFKEYVLPKNSIGTFVTQMTNITEDFLKQEGKSATEVFDDFFHYIGEDFKDTSYIVFGSNDAKMILETCKYSKPDNFDLIKYILSNIVDYLSFLSQYVRDESFNTYSLVNYLKLFGGKEQEKSHDPLNDAIDLKNLYRLVLERKDILYEEYKKILSNQRMFPEPVKNLLQDIFENKSVSLKDFGFYIEKYFS